MKFYSPWLHLVQQIMMPFEWKQQSTIWCIAKLGVVLVCILLLLLGSLCKDAMDYNHFPPPCWTLVVFLVLLYPRIWWDSYIYSLVTFKGNKHLYLICRKFLSQLNISKWTYHVQKTKIEKVTYFYLRNINLKYGSRRKRKRYNENIMEKKWQRYGTGWSKLEIHLNI